MIGQNIFACQVFDQKCCLCVHNKTIVQYIYIYFGIQCFLPMMLPKWPAVEVFPRDLICCWSNSIVAVKYHCIKAKHCHSEAEEGLSIQTFGPFLVGHSDKQHINEQWSKLIGWWMPGPGFMTQSASVQK